MIFSKKLKKFKEIAHGFMTREEENLTLEGNLIFGNQVHKDHLEVVTIEDKGAIIIKTDGLMTKDKGIVLGIKTADCVPILFYEPEEKIIGAVHAGWKGSLLGISGKMIRQICVNGGNSKKIICVLGPHICQKCYTVPRERARLFEKKYLKNECLDLTAINIDQFLREGVRRENIEVLPFCTFHQNDRFFSYRKEGKDCGSMINFIGLR